MDRVAEMFAWVLNIDKELITDETSPDNTPQWDSGSTIELALAIENEFKVKLTDQEILAMRNVGLVRKVLRSKGIADV
jgi:acyl carrier protein